MVCVSVLVRIVDNTAPILITAFVLALLISTEYHLLGDAVLFSQVPWKVAYCVCCAVAMIPMVCAVLYSYYKVIVTSPGFVSSIPWQNEPHYPGQREDTASIQVNSDAAQSHREEVGAPSLTVTGGEDLSDSARIILPDSQHRNFDKTATRSETASEGDRSVAPSTRGTATTPQVLVASGHANPFVVHQLNSHGMPRYCALCRVYKPDDAHHCSECERCVYKFDHHCVFINNCVGRNNYKLFLVFLLYSGSASLIAGIITAVDLILVNGSASTDAILWFVPCIIYMSLAAALLLFYGNHRALLRVGKSTLDRIASGDRRRLRSDCPHNGCPQRSRRGAREGREQSNGQGQEEQQSRLFMNVDQTTDGASSWQTAPAHDEKRNDDDDIVRVSNTRNTSPLHLLASGGTKEKSDEVRDMHGSDGRQHSDDAHDGATGGSNNASASYRASSYAHSAGLTKEQKKREKHERRRRHRSILLGNDTRWWFDYVPIAVRTDDGPDISINSNEMSHV